MNMSCEGPLNAISNAALPMRVSIPDDWLREAGVIGFVPMTTSYHSTAGTMLIPLTEIEPVPRLVKKDFRGFDRDRLIQLLRGFVSSDKIEPVPLSELPLWEFPATPHRFRVRDGFHQLYASIAVGYECCPQPFGEDLSCWLSHQFTGLPKFRERW